MPGHFHGYASDITRTHAAHDAEEFQALIGSRSMRCREARRASPRGQGLRRPVCIPPPACRRAQEHGFIRMKPGDAVESGLSTVFFSHGLGHPTACRFTMWRALLPMIRARRSNAPPPGHPYTAQDAPRSRRARSHYRAWPLFHRHAAGQLRKSPKRATSIEQVDGFPQIGGIRIEDDVACTADAPENLTRDAFTALAAAVRS